MESLIPTNEYTEVDGRVYANPQVALDESNTFIDNLRATQGQQNQEITQQTQNLGTSVPTNLGGLTGAESYFTSRYQVPQTNSVVANLRAVNQAAALNQALQNEQEIWKKKYNDAYRAYQKSAYDKANAPTQDSDETKGGVDEDAIDLTGQGTLVLDEQDLIDGGAYLVEPGSGNIIGEGFSGNNPRYVRQVDGSYKKYSPASTTRATNWLDLGGLLTNYWNNPSIPNSSTRSGFGGRGR